MPVTTTGSSLNNIASLHNLVIFIPGKNIADSATRKALTDVCETIQDCDLHAFYQGKWQAMNEGIYLFIEPHNGTVLSVYNTLLNYSSKESMRYMREGLTVVFPYFTSFSSGAMFGGNEHFRALSPYFARIWDEFSKQIKGASEDYILKFVDFSGLCFLHHAEKHFVGRGECLLKHLVRLLLSDAVDENGVLNVEQTKIHQAAMLRFYSDSYSQSKKCFDETLNDICSNNVVELNQISEYFDSLLEYVVTQEEGSLLYPVVYPFEDKSSMFYVYVCLHVLSILQLSPQSKFRLVINLYLFCGGCIDDFLSLAN